MFRSIAVMTIMLALGAFAQELCIYTSSSGQDYYIPNILISDTNSYGQFTISLCSSGMSDYGSGCSDDTAVCLQDNAGAYFSYGSALDTRYADLVVDGSPEQGVEITFGSGDACSINDPEAPLSKAIISFVCDPSTDAMLTTPIGTPEDGCVVEFQINSSYACPSDVYCTQVAQTEDDCLSNPFCQYIDGNCSVNPNPGCRRGPIDLGHVVGIILSTMALFCCGVGLCVCICAGCARRRCKRQCSASTSSASSQSDENDTLINMDDVVSPQEVQTTDVPVTPTEATNEEMPAYVYYVPQGMSMQMQYLPMQYPHLNPYAQFTQMPTVPEEQQ